MIFLDVFPKWGKFRNRRHKGVILKFPESGSKNEELISKIRKLILAKGPKELTCKV